MKVLLHYKVNGVEYTEEFESPSDAIDAGVSQLIEKRASPQLVSINGKVISNQDDLFIAWEQALQNTDV